MRYLIDTNIFMQIISENSLLSETVRQILEDYENIICISSESIKETIHLLQTGKVKTKKWKIARDVIDFIEKELGYTIKYIKKEHLLTFASLELIEGHNDPSDRLIIAQAITEKMPVISSDNKFKHYRKQKLQLIFNEKYH
jgi:PIN domain nuclease of toxin-antitoxin system